MASLISPGSSLTTSNAAASLLFDAAVVSVGCVRTTPRRYGAGSDEHPRIVLYSGSSPPAVGGARRHHQVVFGV